MGPLDDIGQYAGTTITTRKTDVDDSTDNKPGICSVLIGLLLLPVAFWVIAFIGLYVWAYRLPLCLIGLLVLGLWACAHFGTNNRLVKWHRKSRLSDEQRITIKRRLSE